MAKKQSRRELLTIETIADVAERVNMRRKLSPDFMEMVRRAAECKKNGPKAFIDFADKYRVGDRPGDISIKSMVDKGEILSEDVPMAAEIVETHFCQALLISMMADGVLPDAGAPCGRRASLDAKRPPAKRKGAEGREDGAE